MVLNISINKRYIANRIENIEDIAPEFFRKIDKEIALRERMILIIKGKPIGKLNVNSIVF